MEQEIKTGISFIRFFQIILKQVDSGLNVIRIKISSFLVDEKYDGYA